MLAFILCLFGFLNFGLALPEASMDPRAPSPGGVSVCKGNNNCVYHKPSYKPFPPLCWTGKGTPPVSDKAEYITAVWPEFFTQCALYTNDNCVGSYKWLDYPGKKDLKGIYSIKCAYYKAGLDKNLDLNKPQDKP